MNEYCMRLVGGEWVKNRLEIKCTQGCGRKFIFKKVKFEMVNDEIEKTFIRCPYCSHQYVSFYTDVNIRKMQEKMRKLLEESKSRGLTQSQKKLVIQDINYLQTEIKKEMDKLRKNIENKSQ